MRNKVVPIRITTTEEGTAHEVERHEHDSYGMVGLSRCSSSGVFLFGSSIPHPDFVTLTVRRAHMIRRLNHDDYSGDSRALIEVHLSPAQFAQMITTMNVGDGVPCSISHINGIGMPEAPPPRTLRETAQLEIDEHLAKLAKDVASAREILHKIRTGELNATKANIKEAESLVDRVDADLGSNGDFLQRSLQERVDKQMTEAKATFEAYRSATIERLGLDAIANGTARLPDNLTHAAHQLKSGDESDG